MSNKAKVGQQQSQVKSVWDSFTGLRYEDWSITYSKKSGRASLCKNGKFEISDISLEVLKRAALQRHDIPLNAWKMTA